VSAGAKDPALFPYKPPFRPPFRLRVNDYVRIEGRLGRVVRVSECAAVVLVSRPTREFTTLFGKHVQFRPAPAIVRIASNSEIEILNRPAANGKPQRGRSRR
jgi:hypothetical protein